MSLKTWEQVSMIKTGKGGQLLLLTCLLLKWKSVFVQTVNELLMNTQLVSWSVANSTWNNYWTLSLQKTVCSLAVNNFNEWPKSTASEKRPIFFLPFEEQGESFPDSIVTEDETWVLLKFWEQNTINGMALLIKRLKRSSNNFFSPNNHGHHL